MGRTSDAKARILESAQTLFYARSCENVGVQEICEHAGVKKGSFYHYFPSKKDLIAAVLTHYSHCTAENLAATVFAEHIPPLQRIDRLFDTVYAFHKHCKTETGKVIGCLNINLSAELSTQDSDMREKIAQNLCDSIVPIETALQEAVTNGDLPQIDTQTSAEAIFAYLQGLVVMTKAQNDPEIIRRLAKGAKALIK